MNGLKTDTIINRDALYALRELPEESVHCCVTSPPYYALRDYGLDMQIGREDTPEQYIDRLTEVFRELRRVLRSDGTLWLNIADTYCGTGNKGYHADPKNPKGRNGQQIAKNNRVSGCKQKDLIGIPWLLAFALRADGWYLRSDIIWQKENPMPESVKDRPTRCYEHIFLLTKSKKYFYDAAAIAEPLAPTTAARYRTGRSAGQKYADEVPGQGKVQGLNRARSGSYYDEALMPTMRNRRDVWLINTVPYKGGHFAAFPPKLAETCIKAGCPKGGVDLQRVTSYVKEHEQEFIETANECSAKAVQKTLTQQRKELDKAQNRINELNILFRKLYEDNALGKLSDEQFAFLTSGYDEEKKTLTRRIAELSQEIDNATERSADVKRFVALVRRYTAIEELTYENVHEFIDRILIHELDKETNTRKIEIFYSFVGRVDTGDKPTESISYFRQIGADVKSYAI